MQNDVFTGFTFAISVYGVVVSLILLLFPQHDNYNRRLLGISLFSYSWHCLLSVIFSSNAILQIPHLFRTSVPFVYLVAPASYLYVRATLHSETRPRKQDWIHLVPFVFIVLELLPFYLRDAAYKIREINYYLIHQDELVYLREGFLGKYGHFILRTLLGSLYFYFQWKIVRKFVAKAPLKAKIKHKILLNWLRLYTLLFIATFIALHLTTLFHFYVMQPGDAGNIIISLHLLIVSLILFFKPGVLYNLNQELIVDKIKEPAMTAAKQNELEQRKKSINDLLQIQQRYLVKGYSLADMAADLHIPAHLLSAIIHSEYQMSFTDLVNKYRIDYIVNNTTEEKMSNFTLEAIASEAGFSSRTTFYRAFVKVVGQTPTEYFKMMDK